MASTVARDRLEAAVSHQRAGRFREAVGILQELLHAAPKDADLMQRLGAALAALGQPAQGAPLMAASLELQPGRPSVLLNLARALLALARPEDAPRRRKAPAAARKRWRASARRCGWRRTMRVR